MSHYPANNNAYLYLILLLARWVPAGDGDGPGWVTASDCQAAGVSAGCLGRGYVPHAGYVTAPKSHLTHGPFGEVLGRGSPPRGAGHSAVRWGEVGSPGAGLQSAARRLHCIHFHE